MLADPSFAPALPWRTIGIALLLLALLVAGAIISFGLRQDPLPAPFGPAANGLIAYPADGDIYTRDVVTGEERLVVSGPETDVGATFSRDGQSIAFIRLEPVEADGATLMVAKADGTGQRALTGPLEPYSMSWSPTSDAIALISATPGQDRVLSVISTEPGIEPVTISMPVEPQGTVEWRPPAGDELIFEGFDHDSFRHAIYSVHPDGTSFHPITDSRRYERLLRPIRVHARRPPDDLHRWQIRSLSPSSTSRPGRCGRSEPRCLSLKTGTAGRSRSGSASMLPDGKTIVFGRYWNPDGTEINHQLWAASIADDGATAVPIGPVHRSRGGTNPFWQAVAPDGNERRRLRGRHA